MRLGRNKLARTGIKVSDRTSEPTSANHRQRHGPEHFSFHTFQSEDRQEDDHDDQLAEHGGLADFENSIADRVEPRLFATMRMQFSTMMTELSTLSPKSTAPRLSRLAAIPLCSMKLPAKSIESGIAAGTRAKQESRQQQGEEVSERKASFSSHRLKRERGEVALPVGFCPRRFANVGAA